MSMCNAIEEMRNESFQNGKLEGIQIGRSIGRSVGRSIGRLKGIQEGKTQNAVENARRMLSDGIDPKKVSEYTSLDYGKVLVLREEMGLL